ncbi:MAG: SUMF1/EgtB/PvdO family nonheme iron enzyme [Planctomycetaceae bacterium]|nr:SUMF1/EgtB/PvdO family nonheme iron enzyme [Planctomycetaceae bacterium]
MKHLLVLLSLLVSSCGVSAQDKHALLVGITTYSHSRMNDTQLQYPEADAKSVGEELQRCGYTVTTLLGREASRTAIQKELDKLATQGSNGGVCLVGLFGHGVQYGNDAYFAPYDTGIRFVTDSQGNRLRHTDGSAKLEPDPDSMTSMRSILDALSACGATNRVLLADCCREDPSAARGRAFGSKLSVADLPPGMAALFACSASEKAFEHKDWGHGAFTYSLLQRMRDASADLTANELSVSLHRDVLKAVRDKTNGADRQTVNPITNGIVDLGLTPVTNLVPNAAGIGFVKIPAGSFLMGSPESEEGRVDDEGPVHRVTISKPFYAGKYEVTIGQVLQWLNAPGVRIESQWIKDGGENSPVRKSGSRWVRNSSSKFASSDNQPMQSISWHGAVAFCEWLSLQDSRFTYRLPTEAEWEYMARAGSTTPFWWGDTLNGDRANVDGNYPYGTETKGRFREVASSVGSYDANRWGLYDTSGNVWEWCSDGPREYSSRSVTDPAGPTDTGSWRVLRGGSELNNADDARSARRFDLSPGLRSHNIGFRVVCE